MSNPSNNVLEKIVTMLVVLVSLAALAFTYLAPGFGFDNAVVYGAF